MQTTNKTHAIACRFQPILPSYITILRKPAPPSEFANVTGELKPHSLSLYPDVPAIWNASRRFAAANS